jgi:hypothetical protein
LDRHYGKRERNERAEPTRKAVEWFHSESVSEHPATSVAHGGVPIRGTRPQLCLKKRQQPVKNSRQCGADMDYAHDAFHRAERANDGVNLKQDDEANRRKEAGIAKADRRERRWVVGCVLRRPRSPRSH